MKYIIVTFLLLFSCELFSQDYTRAFGIRTGNNSGFTYKSFVNEIEAFEGILSFRNGIKATILKETHEMAFFEFSDRIFYLYGFGAHLGFINNYDDSDTSFPAKDNLRNNLAHPVLGLDAIIGIEYHFVSVPFIAGFEIKPYFDLFGPRYFSMYSGDLSLSIKYIID